MTRKNEVTINIIHSPKGIWMRAPIVAALQVGVIGIGIWADSAAMQWAGFVMLAFLMIGLAVPERDKNKGLTIAEARRRLDEMERDE